MINGIHVQTEGAGDPVVLLAGLSGNGSGWGDQIGRFATDHLTIVPDHPGVGDSAPVDEISIGQHATAIAGALRYIGCGPAHLVGSSTGGAIAMVMALDHPDVVRTLSLVSSWGAPMTSSVTSSRSARMSWSGSVWPPISSSARSPSSRRSSSAGATPR